MHAYVCFSALSCAFVRIDAERTFIKSARQRAEFNVSVETEHQ